MNALTPRPKTRISRWAAPMVLAGAIGAALGAPSSANAAGGCDFDYLVKPGDTYYSIAANHYGSRREWQLIFEANRSSSRGASLLPGATLYIPCTAAQLAAGTGAQIGTANATEVPATDVPVTDLEPTASIAAPTVVAPAPQPPAVERIVRNYPLDADLKFLTGGGYAPFTDQSLPNEGLVTELVHELMGAGPAQVSFSVSWEDDWSKHLSPMLSEKAYDMGFPWLKPDCEATPDNERCANFHFSDPLMLMPIMLFVRDDNQFRFDSDADIVGRSLCRPVGYFTHDLDRSDRRWISEGHITFVQGETPADCFYKVLVGEVDAATVNLFLGASVILEMGLRNKIVPLEQPVSEEGLHVVISKTHWRGTSHLYRVNAGLKALRDSGRYQQIVSKHLEAFQSRLQ